MSIFKLLSRVLSNYQDFVRSFFAVADERARQFIEQALLQQQVLWSEFLLQASPSYMRMRSGSRLALGLAIFSLGPMWGAAAPVQNGEPASAPARGAVVLNQPIAVYNNWSAYDELSDNIELTEALEIKELGEILRLRRAGVRIDYYMMDAFWYPPTGGYRTFRSPHWPKGPEAWLEACRTNHIKPGLWVASNVPFRLEPLPAWRSSMDRTGSAMCFFDGGFLLQFMQTLQFWYDRGVRMFKFDFANLSIVTPEFAKLLSKEEIVNRNSNALRRALME